jgi:hypothetical protein
VLSFAETQNIKDDYDFNFNLDIYFFYDRVAVLPDISLAFCAIL